MNNKLRVLLSCVFVVTVINLLSAKEGNPFARTASSIRAERFSNKDSRRGTITTIKSPVTKNVKVYRKVSNKSVRGKSGVTKITTTTTTTITTLSRRVTVIKKVTTDFNKKNTKAGNQRSNETRPRRVYGAAYEPDKAYPSKAMCSQLTSAT